MKKIIFFFACLTLGVLGAQVNAQTVLATSIQFKSCLTTYGADTMMVPQAEFPFEWEGTGLVFNDTTPGYHTQLKAYTNAAGCDSIVAYTVNVITQMPSYFTPKLFTISYNGNYNPPLTTKVYFSPGNLQFNAAQGTHKWKTPATSESSSVDKQGTWRFAEHQWDTVGISSNASISQSYDGWISLFGYGTSTMPWTTSGQNGITFVNQNIGGTAYDWAMANAISNGGNQPGQWFSMSYSDWGCLLGGRPNAAQKYSACSVYGIKGLVILPDDWTLPDGCEWQAGHSSINYDKITWPLMEKEGAVFLPAEGYRDGTTIYEANIGYYWTSSCHDRWYNNYYIKIDDNGYSIPYWTYLNRGLSVRPVRR